MQIALSSANQSAAFWSVSGPIRSPGIASLKFQRITGKLRAALLRFADERVKLVSELVGGIRVVKAYCWESPLQARYYYSLLVESSRAMHRDGWNPDS